MYHDTYAIIKINTPTIYWTIFLQYFYLHNIQHQEIADIVTQQVFAITYYVSQLVSTVLI